MWEASNLLSALFTVIQPYLKNAAFILIWYLCLSFTVSWSYILRASQTFFCLGSEMIPKRENCPLCPFYKPVSSISHVSIFSVTIFESSKRVLSALLYFILVLVYPEVKQNLSTCDDFFLEVWLDIIILLCVSNSKNMPLYTLNLFILEPHCIGKKKNSSDVMPLGVNPGSRHWTISHYENFSHFKGEFHCSVCVPCRQPLTEGLRWGGQTVFFWILLWHYVTSLWK